MAEENTGADAGTESAAVVQKPKEDFQLASEVVETEDVKTPPADTAKADTDGDDGDSDDDAGTDADRNDSGKKPRKGGFQKKIERLEAANAALLDQLARQNPQQPKPDLKPEPVSSGTKPKPEDFETNEEYVEKLTDWKVDQKLFDRDQQTNDAQLRTQLEQKVARFDEQKLKIADFEDVVAEAPDPSPALAHAILDSEIGAEIARFIAPIPGKVDQLNRMSIAQVNREIGRIEAELLSKNKTAVADTTKKPTGAPPPIKPISSKASTATPDVENMSYEDYKKARNSGKL